jgi:hypothetical protein
MKGERERGEREERRERREERGEKERGEEGRRREERKGRNMAKDVAKGLNWLHGITRLGHNDVKSANFLV